MSAVTDMKMPKYEKIRNARLLVKEPKKSRILSIINAPAFGWVMTAIIIALVGQYFTVQQKCWADSAPLAAQSQMLSSEFFSRQKFFLDHLKQVKRPEDAVALLDTYHASISEFKDKSLEELRSIAESIYARSIDSDDSFASAIAPLYALPEDAIMGVSDSSDPDAKRDSFEWGKSMTEKSLDAPLTVSAACSPRNILTQMWKGDGKVVAINPPSPSMGLY